VTPLVPLIVNIVGPGTVLPGSGAYSLNSNVVFTVTPGEGASFLGWTGPDGAAVTPGNQILMTGAREVTANFGVPGPVPADVPADVPSQEPVPIADDPAPENAPDLETNTAEPVMDQVIPLDAPSLPKTSGIPLGLLIAGGLTSIGLGIRRRLGSGTK